MSRFVFGFSHRARAGVFDMPNSYRYNILLILIFSKIPLFISIFSRKLISISISSRKFMSISIFSRKFISISIFSKSVNISTINISYRYIYIYIDISNTTPAERWIAEVNKIKNKRTNTRI